MRGGGWRSSMGTAGGLGRTYGLQDHFTKEGLNGKHRKISRATAARVAGYFRPYWLQWIVILICIGITAGLNVLPPLCVGAILDRALPKGDTRLLALLAAGLRPAQARGLCVPIQNIGVE